jgi:hypothetical protein
MKRRFISFFRYFVLFAVVLLVGEQHDYLVVPMPY